MERYNTILSTAPNDVRSLNNLAYALAVNKKKVKEALAFAEKAYSIAHDNEVTLTLDLGYAVAARKGHSAERASLRASRIQRRSHQGADSGHAGVDTSPARR